MMGIVDLPQLGVQMFAVSLCEPEDRVYASLFKQLGILPCNTLDPKNIGLVHPSQNLVMTDPRLSFQFLTAFGR